MQTEDGQPAFVELQQPPNALITLSITSFDFLKNRAEKTFSLTVRTKLTMMIRYATFSGAAHLAVT